MLCFFIEEVLKSRDLNTTVCHDAKTAIDKFRDGYFSVALLDLTLPDEDGLVILRKLASNSKTPFIVISKRNDYQTRIAALELGAQDYLSKPFKPRELVLRIEKAQQQKVPQDAVAIGDMKFLERSHCLMHGNREVRLTEAEFRSLKALVYADGGVVSRDKLMDLICLNSEEVSINSVTVIIHRLRSKLGDAKSLLKTVKGAGYRLVLPAI